MMNLRYVALMSSFGYSNAQLIPILFNSFVSPNVINPFNDILGGLLEDFEPIDLDFSTTVTIPTPDECTGTTTLSIATQALNGISSANVNKFHMNSFQFFPTLSTGIDIAAGIPLMQATMIGNITNDDVLCPSVSLNGVANVTDANLSFKFSAALSIFGGFALENIAVENLDLSWNDVALGFDSFGSFDSEQDSIEDQIGSAITSAVSENFNLSFFQNILDTLGSFSF